MENKLLAIAWLVFLLSACGPTAEVGETLPTLMPDMPGPAQAPEPSYLEINGQVQTARVGSYCWDYTDENGTPVGGACQDSIGISTPIEPLLAAKTITAQLSLPYATPPDRLAAQGYRRASSKGAPSGGSGDVWFSRGAISWHGRHSLERRGGLRSP